jgi:hypothetical protein
VFLQNVNQTTLTGATGTGGTTTTTAETSALSTNDGDMAIVAGTCGNDAAYTTINSFTEAIEVAPSSADGIGGYLSSTGGNVTPGVSHTNVNRQSVIGFVVKAGTGGPTPPGQPSNPSPGNGATNVNVNADLSWTAGTGATSHDVYFGTDSTPDSGEFQGNQTAATFDPGTMNNNTTYYWRIDEVNGDGTTTGNVWSFTTIVAAPGQASNPSPANSAVNVDIDADLSWTPGSGSTSSDVYFGTDSTPDSGEFQGNQTATTFDPGTMANDTTYYWRIDELNAGGTTTGAVWSFTTEVAPQPPGQATNPNPADSAANVSIDADLSWTAGSGSTSSDVYFGTTSPGSFQGNQTATTFDPGTMANNTTYYWRIDEINAVGTTTGTVWSFTTISAGTVLLVDFGATQAQNSFGLSGWDTVIKDTYTDYRDIGPGGTTIVTGQNPEYDYQGVTGSSRDFVVDEKIIVTWYNNSGSQVTFTPRLSFTDSDRPDAGWYSMTQTIIAAYGTGTSELVVDAGSAGTYSLVNINCYYTNNQILICDKIELITDSTVTEEFGDATNTDNPGTIEDTYTNQGGGGTGNYSTDVTLNTYTWPADTVANTTIIKWDLSSIPTSATVTQATLYLYQVSMTGDATYDIGVHKIINVNPVITTCTWNTYDGTNSWTGGADGGQGDTAAAEDTQVVDSTNNVYKTWSVTNMVADWVSTPSSNYGMLVNSDDVATIDSCRYFASTEVVDASTRPKLIVTYSTGAAPPGQASNPSPADSATDVSVDADLSWTAGTDSTSSDVYFGTTSPGTFQANQTATTFDPGTMDNDTTYYWRIDEINAAGTTTGNVWNFTTVAAPAGDVEIIGSWLSGTSHTEESGTDRLLVFTAHVEDNDTDMNLTSVTYGGQSMTKVVEQNVGSGYRAYVVAYVLDEAGINAASGSDFVPTWAQTPSRAPGFSSVFLRNVNQTAPTAATAGNGTESSATLATSALSTNDGDMVFVAGTCGNSGTYSVNNGFTEGIEIDIASADAVDGYKAATGASETPSITHSNVNRQVVIGFVVQVE